MAFEGYTQETLDFLWGIRFNNERSWFLAHKQDYEAHLLAPTRALGEQVYEALHAAFPKEPFLLKLSRIFEIGPDYYSYGMGFWAPKAALMEAYRKAVDEHPEVLEKLVKRFNKQAQFTLSGPEYARKKTAPSPLLAAWYNKKSINLQHDAAPDERMFSQELAQDIIEGFRTLMPLYKYFDALCAAEMV